MDTRPLLSRLFRNCLHFGANLSVVERALSELRTFDARLIEDYLDHHETQLAPLVFWHLKQRGLTSLLGERLGRGLGYRYQRNVARNSLLEHSLEQIIARFSGEGVDVLVLKGASVFTKDLSVFRDAFVLSDLDLLVRPADVSRATGLLLADRYALVQSQVTDRGVKHGLVGADGVTRIDLHSALFWTTRGNYLDYGPTDLWTRSTRGALHGHVLAMLSPEDELCHRFVHDVIGHDNAVLASSTCRLYYLCLMVDFYRDRIDWTALLESLERKGSDRLLVACLYRGNRELGLSLPEALRPLHRQAGADLAVLDAATGSPLRLADYSHRTSLAVLTGRTRTEQLSRLGHLLVHDAVKGPMRRTTDDGGRTVVEQITLVLKILCLQLAAVLYVGGSGLRHWWRQEKAHVR